MAIIAKSGQPDDIEHLIKSKINIDVICLEEASNTWQQLKSEAANLKITPKHKVESSFAAAQLAVAGYAHALVPVTVAETLGVMDRTLVINPERFTRQNTIIARKIQYNRDITKRVILNMQKYTQHMISNKVKDKGGSPNFQGKGYIE